MRLTVLSLFLATAASAFAAEDIITLDGKRYPQAIVKSADVETVTIIYVGGEATIPFLSIPEAQRARLGFSPEKHKALMDARKAQKEEQFRQEMAAKAEVDRRKRAESIDKLERFSRTPSQITERLPMWPPGNPQEIDWLVQETNTKISQLNNMIGYESLKVEEWQMRAMEMVGVISAYIKYEAGELAQREDRDKIKAAVMSREIYVGMPRIAALAALGWPADRRRTVTAAGSTEAWIYREGSRFQIVQVSNDEVTAFQD